MLRLLSQLLTYYQKNLRSIFYYTCFISFCLLIIERVFIIFSYAGHTAGIDNNFVYPVIRALAGQSIYPNPTDYPFAVNPYAPLFFLIAKTVAAILSVSPDNTIAVYRVCRFVCFCFDTGTMLILWHILRKKAGLPKVVVLASATLFLGIINYLGYTLNRADSLLLFFYAATLLSLLNNESKKGVAGAALAAVLTALCIFSKQNGIILLLLVPVWLYHEGKPKAALIYLLISLGLSGLLFIYFQQYYSNGYFTAHVVHSLRNRLDPHWLYVYIFKLMADNYIAIPLTIAFVIGLIAMVKPGSSFQKRLGMLFIFQLLFSTALAFKWGSSRGYYNECFFIAFILIPMYAGRKEPGFALPVTREWGIYLYPAVVIFFLQIILQPFFYFIHSPDKKEAAFLGQLQVSAYVQGRISGTGGHVLDLSDADFNFFKNTLYKSMAAPNQDAVNCCTLPDRIFDYSKLLNGLENGKISYLISDKKQLPDSLWGVSTAHYVYDTTFAAYSVFRFEQRQSQVAQ